jgi:glycosyltransferase involved in cell wall biosynthesis
VWNIVDPVRLRPGLRLPADLRKPAGTLWLGVVGALTPLKGQDVFLDAAAHVAARVPEARFLVVGGEPYRTEARLGYAATLGERVRALGLAGRVDFLGERDDAPAVIANLDVLVQPSRGPEGLGRTILEAMACAVPVVAVDRWGPREIVAHGETGLLVPPNDAAALADAMARLAGDVALRARLGEAARQWMVAHGEPMRLARAFRDALVAIAGLAPARPAPRAQDAAVGGR